MDQKQNKWLLFLIGLAVLVNLSGLFIPLMEPDAATYATLSKNIVLRNDWINLYFNGSEWLDKPHFPFWITACFFKIFGIHTWSYKLPAILFVFMAARYTWLFARKYYGTTVALWAVLVFLTAEHIIISNNDVRAEPYLTGLIIASIYHFRNMLEKDRVLINLVLGALFAACAIMTKGIFTIIPIVGAIAGELIIKQRWKDMFNWKWLVTLVLIGIFIIPELYCLWRQFDERGIKFFLWDSQFGRFTNSGPIKGEGSPAFFLHTLLWAFLPWCILMYTAIVKRFSKLDPDERKKEEWFTFYSVFLTVLIFSLSSFQLPHYTNIIFPMLAILTAAYMNDLVGKAATVFKVLQNIISLLMIITAALLFKLYDPPVSIFTMILVAVFLVALLFVLTWQFNENKIKLALFRTAATALAFNLFLNLGFYPDLLKYESGSEAARYLNEHFPERPVVMPRSYSAAFQFYYNGVMTDSTNDAGAIRLMKEEELSKAAREGQQFNIIKEFPDYHITTLTFLFLNKKTRQDKLNRVYLVDKK